MATADITDDFGAVINANPDPIDLAYPAGHLTVVGPDGLMAQK